MKILMVCLGNICRSPLAEGILQKKAAEAGLDWTIESAGTNSYHIGQAPHHLSQKVAKKNGIDISCQVARRFTPADLVQYDRIYVMAEDVWQDVQSIAGASFTEQKVFFFLDELYPGERKNVPDPWYGDEDGYEEVYSLINNTCDALVKNYLATSKQQQTHNG